MSNVNPVILLASGDDVVVTRTDLQAGRRLNDDTVVVHDTPRGHKIARRRIRRGDPIRKLGQIIGVAATDIARGEHVHIHNCKASEPEVDTLPGSRASRTSFVPLIDRRGFHGYRRPSGTVGTRNYIGVITTVNCAATVARQACMQMEASQLLDEYPNIDGVVPVIHTTGCGMAAQGPGIDILQRTLLGYARHPNFAAVLMVGLGCEVNQIDSLMEAQGLEPNGQLKALTIQRNHGTRRTVDAITDLVTQMLNAGNDCTREWVPITELKLAVQCGGSDGYSTITANPALGAAADLIVRHGGTVILSETPELHGSEHLLASRANDERVGQKLLSLMEWWQAYVAQHGSTLDNNPSPGNLRGGITTVLEKSIGATAKGGTTNLMEVYGYADQITKRGLVFMDSPGYDPCSVTGQVAAGATIVGFTTGRGSVFGNRPCPTIKIATSSQLFADMTEDMDFNAGPIADGDATVGQVGEELFEHILRVASGERTKSEELGFGNDEFVPWQLGAVM